MAKIIKLEITVSAEQAYFFATYLKGQSINPTVPRLIARRSAIEAKKISKKLSPGDQNMYDEVCKLLEGKTQQELKELYKKEVSQL